MAQKVPIEIFRVGKTVVDRDEVRRWLDHVGVSEDYALPEDGAVSNPALLIALAAKRCYKSFEADLNPNLSKVRKDWGEYLDNILKTGHGSVCEHSVFNFAFEGVSRIFTAEMNRHRAGWAISEGSMRFIRFSENVPYWEPTSIQGPDVLADHIEDALLTKDLEYLLEDIRSDRGHPVGNPLIGSVEAKKHATRLLFERQFDQQRDWYEVLEEIWAAELRPESSFTQKKQLTSLFRRGVGMGCATGGVWSGNARALRHVITMRCEPAAEEEILHVFSRVAAMMIESEPLLFGDFEKDEAGFYRPRYRKV